MNPSILIAGIGNIFLGDDAFGVEVAQRLLRMHWPQNVKVADYGIRGFDLTYALLDDQDAVILVDAVPRGEAPGTLFLIEPDLHPSGENVFPETHGMNPMRVLATARSMGAPLRKVLVLGCEPSPVSDEDQEHMGLSEPVARAVDEAVRMVVSLVAQLTEQGEKNAEKRISEGSALDRAGGGGNRDAAGHQTLHSHEHDVGFPH